jgi:hypothetical protein
MEAPAPADGRRTPWLIKGVVLLGAGLLAFALVLAIGRWRFLASSERAAGTVSAVSNELMRDINGRVLGSGYRISVAFRDSSGRPVTVRSPVTSSVTGFRVGDAVDVDYPAGRPGKAVIATFADRWLGPLIVGGIGFVAALIGGLGLWIARQPGTRFEGDGRSGLVMTWGAASRRDPPAQDRP